MSNRAINLTTKHYKKSTNTPFYNKIREFLDVNISVDNANDISNILNSLYDIDYSSVFDCPFTLRFKNLKKDRNMSYFLNDKETEEQKIIITNNWKKNSSSLFKKCTILDAYFHELTHKKQCDYNNLIDELDIKRIKAIDKLIYLEQSGKTYIPYELKLCEIDARMQSTHRCIDLIKKGILPVTPETLYNPLGNIDDILFSFNRFKVTNAEISFDIDKFIKRYIASMQLSLIKRDEDKKEYSFLLNENFKIKFRVELQKKLENFKKDIEFIYSKLLKCYKISPKVRKKLGMAEEAEMFFYRDAKNFKYNDYYLNIMNIDLKDRYYLNIYDMHLDERKYENFNTEKLGENNEKNN